MSEYGFCNKCGAEKVKNPKTGKIFCKDKCWLKSTPPANAAPQPQNGPVATSNAGTGTKTPESVWEAKDRQSAAQTALKFAGDLFQGFPDRQDEAKDLAKWAFHEFIRPAYRGTIMNDTYPSSPNGSSKSYPSPLTEEQEEEINVEDLPY